MTDLKVKIAAQARQFKIVIDEPPHLGGEAFETARKLLLKERIMAGS